MQKHVLLLSKTWGWSDDGGLSILNKEMAIHFAKDEEVHVSFLVAYTSKDQQAKAEECGVHLFGARRLNGLSTLISSFIPPENVVGVNAIIGYGKPYGPHAQLIKVLYANSKWVHIACSSSEDKDDNEIQFCEDADLSFAIGSDVAKGCERRLTFCGKMVHAFIPGILKEFQMYEQSINVRDIFTVVAFYPSAKELKAGAETHSIPAKAVGMLSDDHCQLISVCAPQDKPDEVKEILLQHGISHNQLRVRSHCESIKKLCRLFVEADLLILPFLPSKSEDFGFIALQAISAGLPIRVSHTSGLGKALGEVPHGDSCVLNSNKAENWKRCIMAVKEKERNLRLSEAKNVCQNYDRKYPWEGQCKAVLEKIP